MRVGRAICCIMPMLGLCKCLAALSMALTFMAYLLPVWLFATCVRKSLAHVESSAGPSSFIVYSLRCQRPEVLLSRELCVVAYRSATWLAGQLGLWGLIVCKPQLEEGVVGSSTRSHCRFAITPF